MRKAGYKKILFSLAVCVVFILAIFILCVVTYYSSSAQNITFLSAICIICALLLSVIFVLGLRIQNELSFFSALLKNFNDIAFISYDKRRNTVSVHGDIEEITGIEINSGILHKNDYDRILEKMHFLKDEFENDVYKSPTGKKWYRLASYQLKSTNYTIIRDVTEYMNKIKTINNLRYYDSLTGLLNKQAIADMLKRIVERGYESLTMVSFTISGTEKLKSFEGTNIVDQIISKLALTIKHFEDPQGVIAGRTEYNTISVVISKGEQDSSDYKEKVEVIYSAVNSTISDFSENIRQHLKVYCGYAVYDGNERDVSKMLSETEFAAFSAAKKDSSVPVTYDPSFYEASANEFKKVQIFNEIISESLIDYHYQPIVNAHTGDIYGYEALMRPHEIDGLKLSPLELLDIAQEQNMLERVESITFNLALKALSEHQEFFHDRRLFVNSVSCITLSDVQYEEIVTVYSELFPKLVVEITEANKLSDNIIPVMDKYFKPYKAHVALDDYGAGYSNDKTLIDVMPNYIKIDRSLITNINNDEHKRQLVANIISYASDHGVFSLAEGVETEAELETVIFLGVDLIQGYMTCRPVPIFIHELTSEVKQLIVKYSVMHAKRDDKVFEVKDNKPVDLVNLSVFGYTDITIKSESVDFYGKPDTKLDLRIICPDNANISMRFKDVNIHNDQHPVLEIGANSKFTLWVEGNNMLSTQGIRVPETTSFNLEGAGNLAIECSFTDSVCLGGNSTQTFGKINIDSTGILKLTNKCDNCVCIGGGIGTPESAISINAGELILHERADNTLGIGAINGDIPITMSNCKITADLSGINAVGIGSINGYADISCDADLSVTGAGNNCCLIGSHHGTAKVSLNKGDIKLNAAGINIVCAGTTDGTAYVESSANLEITASGDDCCLIGTLSGSACEVLINDGTVMLTCNAKKIAAIGTISGQCDVEITSGIINTLCEGNLAICIGSLEGSGNVLIGNSVINAVSNSSTNRNITTSNGIITITGGNIYTTSVDSLNAYSPNGTPLCCYIAEGYNKPLDLKISDGSKTYRYTAKPTLLFEGIYMYVPEGSVRYRKWTQDEL